MNNQARNRTNRKKKLRIFKTLFWVLYAAVSVSFYFIIRQVNLGVSVPDDFQQVLIVVIAGSCATIIMIVLAIVAGLVATVNK